MPIYEYACPSCEFKFELLRPLIQASETASCPRCQQSAERVLSTFACFSANESGLSSPLGGTPCSSCATVSCGTCSM